MVPPEGHDHIVHAHCLPVFREDGDGLKYVWADAGDDAKRGNSRSEGAPPACDGIIGGLTGGLTGEADLHSRLKRLLKAGLLAA